MTSNKKKCDQQPPRFHIRIHTPAAPWHPHLDETIEVSHASDFGVWARATAATLHLLTQGNLPLMIGYWADALNVLPEDIRAALVSVIINGYGLDMKMVEPDTVELSLAHRYKPIAPPSKTTDHGLALPGRDF